MLQVDAVGLEIAGATILRPVSFTAELGSQVALLGRSGTGKTTLLRIIAGLTHPSSGSITHDTDDHPGPVIYVPQEPSLFAALTVQENIDVFLRATHSAGGTPSPIDVTAAFELHDLADRLCGELSGGEQQRAALARAVAVAPSLLLVDEPTARQDGDHRATVTTALAQAAAHAIVVMATHDLEVAGGCDQVVDVATDR